MSVDASFTSVPAIVWVAAVSTFGSSSFENFIDCSETMLMVSAPSTRRSAGAAPAPCPRMTWTQRVAGFGVHNEIGNSDLSGPGADIHSNLLIDAVGPFVPGTAPAAYAAR